MNSQELKWKTLVNHLDRWFHNADKEALEAVLSAAAAHPVLQGDPIWLFVQGPSGSGKGEVIVNALRNLDPKVNVLGTINRNSLISFNRGELGGLLPALPANPHGLGKTGIFVFKDFTTMLSLREEERSEVISQLREIYDGSWSRSSGSGHHDWIGKVTCIAACTPVLESAWSMKRDLGERFLTVRWGRTGGTALARAAGRQRGHETTIRTTTAELAQQFVRSAAIRALPDLPDDIFERIGNLSELVACLRANVHRAPGSKREILDTPVPEEPGRIHKSLSALALSHAALFSHPVGEDDYRIARRVALDSIPSARLALLRRFPAEGWTLPATLAKATRMAFSSVVWHADELVALRALELNESETQEIKEYRVSEKFRELISGAGLTLPF